MTNYHLSYHLRSVPSRRWSPFPSVPLGGSVCSFSPLFYGVGLVVLPIATMVFMVVSFLDGVESG